MRTARLFTVWGVCIKGGLPNLRGVCIWGICPTPGSLHPGGLPNLGGGLHPGAGQTPSPVKRMTHRCKNITLPQTSFAGGKYEGVKNLLWQLVISHCVKNNFYHLIQIFCHNIPPPLKYFLSHTTPSTNPFNFPILAFNLISRGL